MWLPMWRQGEISDFFFIRHSKCNFFVATQIFRILSFTQKVSNLFYKAKFATKCIYSEHKFYLSPEIFSQPPLATVVTFRMLYFHFLSLCQFRTRPQDTGHSPGRKGEIKCLHTESKLTAIKENTLSYYTLHKSSAF